MMATTPATCPRPAWRVLGTDEADAETLLQTGLTLLEGLAQDPVPTLRWYRASGSAIVLGRGQMGHGQPELRIHDETGTGAGALMVVTRYSGGGAVLLDPSLLNLDVLLPSAHPWLDDADLSAVFRHVGRAWADGLRHLGVTDVQVYDGPATARRRGSPRQRLLAAVCYATLGRGEVLAGGRKLVGLSQRRRRAGALVQCGLLRRWAPAPLLRALGADPDDPGIAGAAVGLDELLPQPATESAIRRAVEEAFATAPTR